AAAVDESVRRVVERQIQAGVDGGNDGEQPRGSFPPHLPHPPSGFPRESTPPGMRDITHYPRFLPPQLPPLSPPPLTPLHPPPPVGRGRPAARGPVGRECRALRRILGERKADFVEPFMTAASPGIVASIMPNAHYASHAEYVAALADALHVEYAAIVADGFVL